MQELVEVCPPVIVRQMQYFEVDLILRHRKSKTVISSLPYWASLDALYSKGCLALISDGAVRNL